VTPAPAGGYAVTAFSSFDVGLTPYSIQIYTLENNSLIAVCDAGTRCDTSVTPGPNVLTMVGFVGPFSTTPPGPAPLGMDQSNSLTVPTAPPSSGQGAPIVSGPVIGPPGIPGGTPQL
jgi:hypothetical protein